MQHILILDDELSKHAPLDLMRSSLRCPPEFEVCFFEDSLEAYEFSVQHSQTLRMAIVDYAMPGCDGVHFLQSLSRLVPDSRRILLSNLDEAFIYQDHPAIDRVLSKWNANQDPLTCSLPDLLQQIIHDELALLL